MRATPSPDGGGIAQFTLRCSGFETVAVPGAILGFNPSLNKQLRLACELRRADVSLRRAIKDAIGAEVPVTIRYKGAAFDFSELSIEVGAIMARSN